MIPHQKFSFGQISMIIMPGNNLSNIVHYLARNFPGSIGMMNSPRSWKNPVKYIPYAIDNGGFLGFDEAEFLKLLARLKNFVAPLWVAVPDVVADAEATNRLWHEWKNRISYKLAFVVQDGHEPQDVPQKAYAVFIGGSTKWKLSSAHKFKGTCQWLHIGRVNTSRRLQWAKELGADSVDGTGWFRSPNRSKALVDYITGKGQLMFDFVF